MCRVPRHLAWVLLLLVPAASAQQPFRQRWTAPRPKAPVSFSNSPRLEKLVRGGHIYLTLEDAIALAIENNLDVEMQRWNYTVAAAESLRAQGGGTLRGLNYTLAEAPAGVGGPTSALQTAGATQRSIPGTSVSTNPLETGALGQIQSNLNLLGQVPLSSGTPVPLLDPALTARTGWLHQTTIQTNPLAAGTPGLVSSVYSAGTAYRQGLGSGTLISGAFDNTRQTTNALSGGYSPFTTSAFSVALTHPLMRGSGWRVNLRYRRMAENEARIADLLFRQQLVNTVYGVTRLYTDFVALSEDVKVKQEAYALAQKLLADTTAQVEQGTLASVEVSRAKAQVFSTMLDLEKAQGLLEEQQAVLKNVLTRRGGADPVVQESSIIALTAPAAAAPSSRSMEDHIATANALRPDLQQAALQLANIGLSLDGARSAVRPQLDLVLSAQNSGLAGRLNPAAVNADPALAGGYGSALAQLLRHNYPTYSAGIQLELPLHNRVAQADLARDEALQRQTEIRVQQLRNQARLEVEDAFIALRRARAASKAATQAREYQEESLAVEQARFDAGVSTSFLLVQVQSAAVQARSTEVAARAALAKAQAALERATGAILESNHISIEAARKGAL